MKAIFDKISIQSSRLTTRTYSTSFSLGIYCLAKPLRDPIYSIYGFVRFADEIVDSFHGFNKEELLNRFKTDTYLAIDEKISLNPILNSFQETINKYKIDKELIETFLHSMEMDLDKTNHSKSSYKNYILGSAEVVGLMCLKVFVQGDNEQYLKLKPHAMSLGAAFQKVNFLRDLRADYKELGRSYFPELNIESFNASTKARIENEIHEDFNEAIKGIRQLPRSSRFGVYVAYVYYLALFKKIESVAPEQIMEQRFRIRNRYKLKLLATSYVKHQLNRI